MVPEEKKDSYLQEVRVTVLREGESMVLEVAGFPGAPLVRLEYDPLSGRTTQVLDGDLLTVRRGSVTDVVLGDRLEVTTGVKLARTGGDHVVLSNGVSHSNPNLEEHLGEVRRLEAGLAGLVDLGTDDLVRSRRIRDGHEALPGVAAARIGDISCTCQEADT